MTYSVKEALEEAGVKSDLWALLGYVGEERSHFEEMEAAREDTTGHIWTNIERLSAAVGFNHEEEGEQEDSESNELVGDLRGLAKRLENAPNAGEPNVLFVNWCEDERDDPSVQAIRNSALSAAIHVAAKFTPTGDEDVPRVSKRDVAALLAYIADTLEE